MQQHRRPAGHQDGADAVLDEEVRVQLQAPAVQVDGPVRSAHRAPEHPALLPADAVVEHSQHGADPGLAGDVGTVGDVGLQMALDVGPVLGEAAPEQGHGAVGERPQPAGVALAELGDDPGHPTPGAVPGERLPQLGRGGGRQGVEFVGELPVGGLRMGHQEVRHTGTAGAHHLDQRCGGLRYPAAHPGPPAGAAGAGPAVGAGQGGQDVVHR